VTYPDEVPAHTKVQKLYFGEDLVLTRLDYVADVLGGVAAPYCYDHAPIDGLVFPTLRRVVRRTLESPPVRAYLIHSRLHQPCGPQMIRNSKAAPAWNEALVPGAFELVPPTEV
jgi:hypothetical protein